MGWCHAAPADTVASATRDVTRAVGENSVTADVRPARGLVRLWWPATAQRWMLAVRLTADGPSMDANAALTGRRKLGLRAS
jgi:hypothetical protein